MKCDVCKKNHKLRDPAFALPDVVSAMNEAARQKTVELSDATCVVRVGSETWYFVLGLLYVAFNEDPNESIAWRIWVEVDKDGYDALVAAWSPTPIDERDIDDDSELDEIDELDEDMELPVVAGKLANHIRGYPETLGLPVTLQSEGAVCSPEILLVESPHPFVQECIGEVSIHRLLDWLAIAPPSR